MKKSTRKIVIKGACERNLKNIDIELPRNEFIVFTGLLGSGKSTLAMDTILADISRTNEPCKELVTSELVTLSGLDGSLNASMNGSGGSPEFMINNSGNWVTSGTISAGQTLRLRQMTTGHGQWQVNVSVGLITRPWHVLTNACY